MTDPATLRPVPSRGSLLDRPQPWGILPTTRFWNDPGPQRLVLPIVAAAALVLAPLLLWLTIRLQLSVWLFVAASLLLPYLVTGLVERHIRRALARRPAADRLPPAEPRPVPDFPLQRIFAGIALASGILALLAALEVDRTASIAGAVLAIGGGLVITLAPRRRALPRNSGHDERALPPRP